MGSKPEPGRFLAGNGGNGGRRKGSRNRLIETFLAAVASDFEQHGASALAKLRVDDPASYLRIVGSFVPREPLRSGYGTLSDDEMVEAIEEAERDRMVRRMIEAGEKQR